MPAIVALVITAGYWWTSSTSFANPAITIARALTDSFAGIRMAGRSRLHRRPARRRDAGLACRRLAVREESGMSAISRSSSTTTRNAARPATCSPSSRPPATRRPSSTISATAGPARNFSRSSPPADLTAREALRETKSPAAELGLLDPAITDDQLHRRHDRTPHPREPAHRRHAKRRRPLPPDSERVLDLLDRWPTGPFNKEDGSPLIDADGKRV